MDELLHDEKDTTLKYDGTTKQHCHYGDLQIATEDKTFLVGMREMSSGTASAYAETVINSTKNIGDHLLNNVTNTMTDRVVTNKAANRKIKAARDDLESHGIISIVRYMHPLDSIEKKAMQTVNTWEEKVGAKEGKM